MNPFVVSIVVFAAGLLFLFLLLGLKILRPYEKGVIETLGRYTGTRASGLTLIIPFVQTMQRVDLRETVVEVAPQEVITKDNVVVRVDAVVYLEVVDPFNYRYNVEDFWMAIIKLAQTNLRNVIGDMSLDESLVSRDSINQKLRSVLDQATDRWGARVTRVEIQRIEPPTDVTQAMHRQMKAERDRRARILDAEGEKQSAILVAEGNREAQIKRAEGEAEAIKKVADAHRFERLTVAEGEALAIESVFGAIHRGQPTKDLIAIKYLEALRDIADGQSTKVFLPYEATGILGSVAGIAELFKDKASADEAPVLSE